MESLAAPLELALELQGSLEKGESLRLGIKNYLSKNRSPFANEFQIWFLRYERGVPVEIGSEWNKNAYRRTLLQTIKAGLEGQSIHEPLSALVEELFSASIDELEEEVRLRPVKLLIPVLVFQFPAYLLLLLGPVLQKVLSSIS